MPGKDNSSMRNVWRTDTGNLHGQSLGKRLPSDFPIDRRSRGKTLILPGSCINQGGEVVPIDAIHFSFQTHADPLGHAL